MAGRNLAEILSTYTQASLLNLARLLPEGAAAVERATPKGPLIDQIARSALQAGGLQALWADLTDSEQQVVIEALADPVTPNALDIQRFQRLFGRPPLHQNGVPEFNRRLTTPAPIFFDSDCAVPTDVANTLRPFLELPKRPVVALHAAPPATETYTDLRGTPRVCAVTIVTPEQAVFHDALALLRLIEAGRIKVNPNTLTPAQTALKTLNAALELKEYPGTEGGATLRASEAIRTFGLIRIVLAAGLATPDPAADGKLTLTDTGQDLLHGISPSELRIVFDNWKQGAGDEVLRIGGLHGAATAMAVQGTPPPTRRAAVLNTLARMPVGKWVDVEDFFRAVLAVNPGFRVEADAYSRLWVGAYGHANNSPIGPTDTELYWRAVSCQLILVILFEYAATLGLIDIAYLPPRTGAFYLGIRHPFGIPHAFSQYDVLRFIRLTPLGQYLLRVTDNYAAAPRHAGPALRVLPNHQIVAATRMAGTSAGHPILAKFCDRVSDDVYALSPAKALKTVEKGDMSAAGIAEWLRREAGGALPKTLELALAELGARHGRISAAGSALLFKIDEPVLAAQLEHDRTLVRLGCRRAGDWMVVPKPGVAGFRRRVRELGYGVARAVE